MPIKSSPPRIFGVLRVVESEICFLDETGVFDELSDQTSLFISRDECYTAARKVSGLVVSIGWKVAILSGLRHPIWDEQRAAAEATGIRVVA
jgi:hypothetical protein